MTRNVYLVARYADPRLGGGALRLAQAEMLSQRGFRCVLVLPDWQSSRPRSRFEEIVLPAGAWPRLRSLAQRAGIVCDNLHSWANQCIEALRPRICRDDVLLCSSGGDLATLKVGHALKSLGCTYVADLHDPVAYASLNGDRIGRWASMHVDRTRAFIRLVSNADVILTSTNTYADFLKGLLPVKADVIRSAYFGYIHPAPRRARRSMSAGHCVIAYGGSFSSTQSPEILAEVSAGLGGVEVVYLGNASAYRPLAKYRDRVRMTGLLGHEEYLSYMVESVDVGFVSLANRAFRYCIPSKIFEYINLGLPILAALPDGEAKDLINENGYGIAVSFDDMAALRAALHEMTDPAKYEQFRQNVVGERARWRLFDRLGWLDSSSSARRSALTTADS